MENASGTSIILDEETPSGADMRRDGAIYSELPKLVSLFCGAGGMDLGFKQAGFRIAIAFDSFPAAIDSHRRNFRRTQSILADLVELGPEGVLAHVKESIEPGLKIGVIGGPPCQGFSRANTRALADDPRNELPQLYLDIVRLLQDNYEVEFIVLENVLGIRDKKHEEKYSKLLCNLGALDFSITESELCAADFGVAQNRRRVLISGLRKSEKYSDLVLRKRSGDRSVRDAIGAIGVEPAFFSRTLSVSDIPVHPNHWTMQPKSRRFLDESFRSGDRSFKRLSWDHPSPTIAFGNREIHVHPNGKRRLSIFESMLLQGFPEKFVLLGNLSNQVEQISNAVPPPLARSVALAVRRALRRA